jgi:hypothetical protein
MQQMQPVATGITGRVLQPQHCKQRFVKGIPAETSAGLFGLQRIPRDAARTKLQAAEFVVRPLPTATRHGPL